MQSQKGTMAEWLGRGLQNLVRRFDSVWYLKKDVMKVASFFLSITESLIRFNIIKKELPNSEQPSLHYSLFIVHCSFLHKSLYNLAIVSNDFHEVDASV